MIAITVVLLAAVHVAQAAPDCAPDFGRHPLPPAPVWAPPVHDPPYAHFEWGTDASTNAYQQWWRVNAIQNGPNGPPLPLNWDKGGIFQALSKPLPNGESRCKHLMLNVGQQLIPVLDRDAPIIYDGGRRQDAVVYIDNTQPPQPQSGPNNPQQLPGLDKIQPPQSPQRSGSAEVKVQTSYEDERLGVQHVTVHVTSDGAPGKYSLFVQKEPKELIVGISDLADALNLEQLNEMRLGFERQGFTVEQASLAKFAGPEAVQQLFWSVEAASPQGELVLLGTGGRGEVSYFASETAVVQRRSAIMVLFDAKRRPIAADRITLVVPAKPRQ